MTILATHLASQFVPDGCVQPKAWDCREKEVAVRNQTWRPGGFPDNARGPTVLRQSVRFESGAGFAARLSATRPQAKARKRSVAVTHEMTTPELRLPSKTVQIRGRGILLHRHLVIAQGVFLWRGSKLPGRFQVGREGGERHYERQRLVEQGHGAIIGVPLGR
jgi:hypothetical protein